MNLNTNFLITTLCLIILTVVMPSKGSCLTIQYDPSGSIWQSAPILGVGTYGDDMDGMEVMVTYDNGTTESSTWLTTLSNSGSAVGNGWSLQINNGSTYEYSSKFAPWEFTVDQGINISSFLIDAAPGYTIFDTNAFNEPNTPSSSNGGEFKYYNMFDPNQTTVTYSGLISIAGQTPIGDIYRYMNVDFASAISDVTLTFSADTDSVDSLITAAVPEPSTFFLLGVGMLGITRMYRKKI